jgi:hypothetical protein
VVVEMEIITQEKMVPQTQVVAVVEEKEFHQQLLVVEVQVLLL